MLRTGFQPPKILYVRYSKDADPLFDSLYVLTSISSFCYLTQGAASLTVMAKLL